MLQLRQVIKQLICLEKKKIEMIIKDLEQNDWKVQPENTLQVDDAFELPVRSERDWRAIFISLLFISFVLSLLVVATLLLEAHKTISFPGRRLLLDDLKNTALMASPMWAQWLTDADLVYFGDEGNIEILNLESKEKKVLIPTSILNQTRATEFVVSSDGQYVLLVHNVIKGRLYCREAHYSIYHVEKNHCYPLKLYRHDLEHTTFQYVTWIGQNESSLLIVSGSDVYFKSSPTEDAIAITEDAAPNDVFNGVPDLIYEEILATDHAMTASPGGMLLAVISFDDTEVMKLPVLGYSISSYPVIQTLRYPIKRCLLTPILMSIQRL